MPGARSKAAATLASTSFNVFFASRVGINGRAEALNHFLSLRRVGRSIEVWMSSDDMPVGLQPSTARRLSFGAAAALMAGVTAIFAEMPVYFWIAVGSALGGIARYWCSGVSARLLGETFPWGTLLINVVGSFAIGFFGTLTGPDGRIFVGSTARQFVMIGICGGFTTFSSFSLQTLNLLNDSEWVMAGSYVGASITLCLIGVWAGYALAVALNTLRFS